MAPESQTSDDNALGRALGPAVAQRRRQQGARRGAGEHAFLQEQLARGGKALRVRDGIGRAHQRKVGIGRHEVLADAFDRPAARLDHPAGLDQRRKHRALRVGKDHLGRRRCLAHEPAYSRERAAGADADDNGIDLAIHLAQDLRPGGCLVGARVGRIGELVDEERAGGALRDRLGEVLIIVGVALADVGTRDDDFGAHRLGVQHLLARHLVRHHEQGAVAFARADEGKAEPGIAGGRLDNGAAGLELSLGFRRLDHGARRPVLDRARGVGAFELEKQPARAAIDARDLDERRFADEVEDRSHAGTTNLSAVIVREGGRSSNHRTASYMLAHGVLDARLRGA